MGYKKEARAIHECIDDSLPNQDPMTLLTEIVRPKKVPGLTVDRLFKRGQNDMIDLLKYDGWPYSMTVQLPGSDAGVEHVDTIVGRWIFDATMMHALSLTHKCDYFCSSNKEMCVLCRSQARSTHVFHQKTSSWSEAISCIMVHFFYTIRF